MCRQISRSGGGGVQQIAYFHLHSVRGLPFRLYSAVLHRADNKTQRVILPTRHTNLMNCYNMHGNRKDYILVISKQQILR
jgi:hypothetical protein